jgi:CubicO group peptidase (beta-lactamase class C family)
VNTRKPRMALATLLGRATLLLGVAAATTHAAPNPGSAELGLMQGFPPPADKIVRRGNFMTAPANRWAFQHIRELQPTREISRGDEPASKLESVPLDLGKVTGTVREGRVISLDQLVEEAHTDAMLVMHKGRIVYERYLNGQTARTQHQMFSATKSFVGTLMLMLIEEGKVDPTQTVASLVPELKDSAFGDATVQQVLDMTTAVDYREIYDDPTSEIWRYGYVFGVWGTPPADYKGPLTIYDYLPTLKKEGTHGVGFHYVTPNTDVLGWIIRRVTGKAVDRNIEERLWQPIGAERDGYIWLDGAGNEMAGGGLNITARDAARFGQMILHKGRFNGRQVIPEAVATRILRPGDPEKFTHFYKQFRDTEWYGTIGYGYHDQWWTFNNAHKTTSAIGVHGQYIWLDPIAEMVVVKQSSSPDAEGGANESNDTDGPLLYMALAEYLMRR